MEMGLKMNLLMALRLVMVSSLTAVGLAHAAQPLQGRDINGNAVDASAASAVFEYDPNLNITWLRDWDMAHKDMSANNSGSVYLWSDVIAWVSTLTVGAFGGWSLPATTVPGVDGTCGPNLGYGSNVRHYDCTGSPLGYLFYTELGNQAFGIAINAGPFPELDRNALNLWTSTEVAPRSPGANANSAWAFAAHDGATYAESKRSEDFMGALAIRPGDVLAAVPEPQNWAMMLAGLSVVATRIWRLRRRLH
jgi:hypothetical protein